VKAFLKKILPGKQSRQLRTRYLYLRGLCYRGKNYYCPFCNHSYRKLLPGGFNLPVIESMQIIGAGLRQNMVCPGCGSTDRDRLLYVYLNQKKVLDKKGLRILHIAPEPMLAQYIASNNPAEYICGAMYHEGVYYGTDLVIMDVQQIPFPPNAFDLLICNHVLEHVADDLLAMQEIYRVMDKGGIGILQVPWSPMLDTTITDESITSREGREAVFGQFDHVRLYGKDYPAQLEKAGFTLSKVSATELLTEENTKRDFAINQKEVIFVVEKQT